MKADARKLKIGWAAADITPDKPVVILGQHYVRVSEGVMDPVTVTAMAVESDGGEHAVLVSCDLAVTPEHLRDSVRERVCNELPDLDPLSISLFATHTHAAPDIRIEGLPMPSGSTKEMTRFGLSYEELGVTMPADEYIEFASGRIAGAICRAWNERAPGGTGFGLGHALVGRNRRICYYNGDARMYGNTNTPDFSHVEGFEDHDVNVLCTYDADSKLTGMIINIACPSQVSEHSFLISADFWHETRVELRRRLGKDLFVLPQCSAAGDQSPHILRNRQAEARMLRMKGLAGEISEGTGSRLFAPDAVRREIAGRLADAVTAILPCLASDIDFSPKLARQVATIQVPRNLLTEKDVREALDQAAELEKEFANLRADLEAHPEKKQEPHWYKEISKACGRMRWFAKVRTRYEEQQNKPLIPIETMVLRLGEVVFATNPFEYYLDFGIQIKARSPAVQTFVVQLAGNGSYVPTSRAVAGKSYGAVPASNLIGPDGGREVVEKQLELINSMFAEGGDGDG